MRVGVLGAGSWGTTVAHLCCANGETILYARSAELAETINQRHENPTYLEGFELNRDLTATNDLAEVVANADVLAIAVPSAGFRSTLSQAKPNVQTGVPIVSLTKGFEPGTTKRMTEIVEDELPGHPVGVLTGPNLAKEILAGHAAAAVMAFADEAIAQKLQPVFSIDRFRVYTSVDVVGCELGGAFKNVIALAAGMADGLGTGNNTRAAVITRGLAEMTRLGVVLGGDPATFAGLAGMGDLLATCMSPQSRNRYVGEQLGKGRRLDDVQAEMNQVAEGIKSAAVVCELAARHGVYTPIAEQMRACLEQGRSANEAYVNLLRNPANRELDTH